MPLSMRTPSAYGSPSASRTTCSFSRFAMTARAEMANRSDAVHGGFPALLADSAMGQAVSTARSEERRQASFDLKLSFIAPGRIGERLEAVATVLHSGRRTGVADCRVTGEDGRLVATATATFIIF